MNHATIAMSSLLPYDANTKKHGELQTGLQEYKFLLSSCLQACNAWINGELEQFDALVGENACEIRAVWLILQDKFNHNEIEQLINQLLIARIKIDELLSPKAVRNLMYSDHSLQDIIGNELAFYLREEHGFILGSLLLYKSRVVFDNTASICRLEKIDPKKLLTSDGISVVFIKRLISKLKRYLARLSVEFVRHSANLLKDNKLIKMVSRDYEVVHNTLLCIPMFWTYKILLEIIKNNRIDIVLHAKFLTLSRKNYMSTAEEKLLFKYHSSGYSLSTPSVNDLNSAALIIQGVVLLDEPFNRRTKDKWLEKIKEQSIFDIILAGAADHRQYPDSKHDITFETLDDTEFKYYKSLAKERGYSLENPTTFFIQHVYAAYVHRVIESIAMDDKTYVELVYA